MHENQVAQRVKRALKERGSSLNAWARKKGYTPRSAYSAVDTWADRTDREPLGGISRAIMADLRKELGPKVVPRVKNKGARR